MPNKKDKMQALKKQKKLLSVKNLLKLVEISPKPLKICALLTLLQGISTAPFKNSRIYRSRVEENANNVIS